MRSVIYSAFAILIIPAILGCKSYSYIDEYQLPESTDLLPKLTVITDQEIFANNAGIYSEGYSRSLGTVTNLYEVERQFNKFVLEHLTSPKTEHHGYAVLRVNHLKVINDLPVLSVLSIVTLGESTILGIPAGRYHVEVDASMEILDREQNILGVYNGKGKSKAFIAMYYGYGEKQARDRCLFEAIEISFMHIHERFMRDFDFLEEKLLAQE